MLPFLGLEEIKQPVQRDYCVPRAVSGLVIEATFEQANYHLLGLNVCMSERVHRAAFRSLTQVGWLRPLVQGAIV